MGKRGRRKGKGGCPNLYVIKADEIMKVKQIHPKGTDSSSSLLRNPSISVSTYTATKQCPTISRKKGKTEMIRIKANQLNQDSTNHTCKERNRSKGGGAV